jgi:serine/threonine protein kinase
MSNYPIKFGKYLLLERVNVGGMAEVFKAKTFGVAGFERILAIKRILPNLVEDDEFIRMFIDEARIAVQLNHSNIVQIYELGKHGDHYYIAMEYLPSRDLRAILDRMRSNGQLMPIPQAAYITKKVCEGLHYAHKKTDPSGAPMNIIHRDVSPQNILVGFEGEVKVIDFGIAKAANRASKTQAGVLKGKFGYMSPEQVRGLPTDRRSDIFAVGVLLYEMLTGERLFIGESDFSTLERVRNAEVIPPTNFNKKISPALEQVVLKSLAREVEDRHQWAIELAEDLDPFLTEDRQVFTMKRLAAVMKETYAAEISVERQKMEEFLKISGEDAKHERGTSPGAVSSVLPLHTPPHTDPAAPSNARTQHRPPTEEEHPDIGDDEGFGGEDKTFVIEASAAGLALQNQVTEDPQPPVRASNSGPQQRASGPSSPAPRPQPPANGKAKAPEKSQASSTSPKPRPENTNDDYLDQVSLYDDNESSEDDSRTLVSAPNPFFDKQDKTGQEDDDEIDASEAQDAPRTGVARSREELSDAPTMAASAASLRTAPEMAGASMPRQAEMSGQRAAPPRETTDTKTALPNRPLPPSPPKPNPALDPVAAAMEEEERMALEVLKGTTGGRGDGSRSQPQAPSMGGRDVVGGPQLPSPSYQPPYDSSATQQGDAVAGDYTAPPSEALDVDDAVPDAPVEATIPPHLMKLMLGMAAASVLCFLVVVGVLVVKLMGRNGESMLELYAIGDVAAPADLSVSLDGEPVGSLGTPIPVHGEATIKITGTGIRPITRKVRSTGGHMRQPVLLVAESERPPEKPKDGVVDPKPPANGEPPTAAPVVAGGWRLSLAAVADDTGKPLVGAEVLVDGQLYGRTPLEAELDPALDKITLRIKKDGYRAREVPIARAGRDRVGPATVRLTPGGEKAEVEPAKADEPKPGDREKDGEKDGEKVAAVVETKGPDKAAEKVVEKTEKTPDKATEKAAEPPKTEKQPDKVAVVDKNAERTGDKTAKAPPPAGPTPPVSEPKSKPPRPTTSLQIGTRPFAKTYIDGRVYGSTPFYSDRALTVTTGKHKLEFEVAGTNKKYRYELVINSSDKDNKIVIDFSKNEQRVTGPMTLKALP